MVTAVIINLDFIPLAFFFFLYSALEILIARTMEDHRFRLINIDQEDEEFESEEEFEDEDEEDGEFEEDGADPFRQRIILPVEFEENGFDDGEEIGGVFEDGFEDDDEFEDDGFDEDEEEEDYEEDDEELGSLERMLNRVPIEYDDDDDDDDEDYEDEEDEDEVGDVDGEDYEEDEEDDEVVDRVSSSGFNGRRLQVDDEAEMESHRFLSSGFGGRSLQVDDEAEMESSLGFGGRSLQFDTEAVMGSRRVSRSVFYEREGVVIDSGAVESTENMNDLESCEGKNEEQAGSSGSSGEVHGLFCSICFEAWTSGGEHQICCLPCGHIYGLSCIKKWLQQSRPFGKCPQCNNLCTFKDVRVLYASRLCVADEELHKRVRSLEAKCAYLEQKAGRLTPAEMVDQICSNPAALQQLATAIAGLYHQPVSP